MKQKRVLNNVSIDYSSLNTICFNPNYNHYTINNISNIYPGTYITSRSKKVKDKEMQNKKVVNDNKKQNILDNNKYTNSNLKPQKYIKPLNFALNKHISLISTQFNNYNKISRNRKDNILNTLSDNNESKYYANNNYKKISKTKIIQRNKNKKNKSNSNDKKNKTIDIKKLIENKIYHKIILIQSYFRSHFARNKLCKILLLYSKLFKIKNFFNNKYICHKNIFINNLFSILSCINAHIKNKNDKQIINNSSCSDNSYCTNINIHKNIKRSSFLICNVNNIMLGDENNNKDNINQKEKQRKELINHNKTLEEQKLIYQKKEEINNNIRKDNDDLINISENNNKEKDQLLIELRTLKEKYNQLLITLNLEKFKKISSFNISKQTEINIIVHDLDKKQKEKDNVNDICNENNSNNKGLKNDRKEREKYLRNLFKNKIFEMKEYIHKYFTKFYYNGIFLQMTGKLTHLNNEIKKNENEYIIENKNINQFSNNSENNINTENNKEEMEEKNKSIENNKILNKENEEKNDLKERKKKSRGLRKLMNKKAKEKLETLRANFFKFYRAGIYAQFRKLPRRRSCIFNGKLSLQIINEIKEEKNPPKKEISLTLTSKAIKEKEELKNKTYEILEKIIFKNDRMNMIALKKSFNQFRIKAKLDAVQNIINNDKGRKRKKKKKIIKKSVSNQEREQDNNAKKVEDIYENKNNAFGEKKD